MKHWEKTTSESHGLGCASQIVRPGLTAAARSKHQDPGKRVSGSLTPAVGWQGSGDGIYAAGADVTTLPRVSGGRAVERVVLVVYGVTGRVVAALVDPVQPVVVLVVMRQAPVVVAFWVKATLP
jgi:hypothetical protein